MKRAELEAYLTDRECAACIYWSVTYSPEHGVNQGQCRRYAPCPTTDGDAPSWPMTEGDAWCGEWASIPEYTASARAEQGKLLEKGEAASGTTRKAAKARVRG
jgi:hypothetical protein